MNILFLTSRLPFPPIGGDKLRTYNFIKHLSSNHNVTLISFIENEKEKNCLQEYQVLYKKLITIKLTRAQSLLNCVLGLFSKNPLQIHYYRSRKMQAAINKEITKGYDVVFCHLIRMNQYLPHKNSGILKVVDFTDAISLNYSRSKNYSKGLSSMIHFIESKRVYNYELHALKNADISLFISEIDAKYLCKKTTAKVKIVKNGVDLNKFKFNHNGYKKNQIIFLGNMRTFPNLDAVLYFTQEIFPIILKKRPDAKFYVVGNEPDKKVKKLHNNKDIFVTGQVKNVHRYLKESAVLVAPMRTGAGIQNKILEALATGTPVVTTPIGAEGLDSSYVLVGETSLDIVNHILELMQSSNLRNKIIQNGRRYVEKKFSWETSLKDLNLFLTKKLDA